MQPYLLFLPLAPVLFLQGKYAQMTTPRLPEAEGDRTGISGRGPVVKLLILGDSAAAGVGAARQDLALAGALVQQLADQFEVRWRVHARTGNTTSDTLRGLAELGDECFDVIVVSTGVNDVTRGVNLTRWRDQLRALHGALIGKLGARLVLYSGVPPMGRFVALPQPLRGFMGLRASLFDLQLQKCVASLRKAAYLAVENEFDDRSLAHDGFHPSEYAYGRWAEILGNRLKAALLALEVAVEPEYRQDEVPVPEEPQAVLEDG
ncbi:MAG: SGNH/GDSL hydrolase family protein [Ketobacteraceae bacterium]|nr:SGNH/GDSL hydrolase family protein [Ketobacteraceae bacterium]